MLKLFVCKNKLTDKYEGVFPFVNEKVASVEMAQHYGRISPIDEWELYEVGEFDPDTGRLFPDPNNDKHFVEFDLRRLNPYSVTKPVTEL